VKLLRGARKPVLGVPGNHDTTPLATDGSFINIHRRMIELDGLAFVGYGCTSVPAMNWGQISRWHYSTTAFGAFPDAQSARVVPPLPSHAMEEAAKTGILIARFTPWR